MAEITLADSAANAETELRNALAGRRLIFEIGIDKSFRDAVLERVLGVIEHECGANYMLLASHYPALLSVAIAAEGVFEYHEGDLWGRIRLPHSGGWEVGKAFEFAIASLGLETFRAFDEQSASRYVSRVLAHGGVPVYCLGDLFRLVHQARARGFGDEQEIIDLLRDGAQLGVQLDRPIVRFLCSSGSIGADFLERVLELPEAADGALASADLAAEVGLPSYVVQEYRRLQASLDSGTRVLRMCPRPRLLFRYEALSGPELQIPSNERYSPVEVIHQNSGRTSTQVTVTGGADAALLIQPAPRWRVTYMSADDGSMHHSGVAGVTEERPFLVFRLDNGEQINDGRFCPVSSVVVLAPTLLESSDDEVRVVQHYELRSKGWDGWTVHHLELGGSATLTGALGLDRFRINLGRQSRRALNVENEVPFVSTAEGHPILDGPPIFRAVPWEDGAESLWRIVVRQGTGVIASLQPAATPDAFSRQIASLLGGKFMPALTLRMLGPMGESIRYTCAIAPRIQVLGPSHALMPGESTDVRIEIGPGCWVMDGFSREWPLSISADNARQTFTVGSGGEYLSVQLRLPIVRWRIVSESRFSQFDSTAITATYSAKTVPNVQLILDLSEFNSAAEIELVQGNGGGSSKFQVKSGPITCVDLSSVIADAISDENLYFDVILHWRERSSLLARFEESISVTLEAVTLSGTPTDRWLHFRLSDSRRLAGRALQIASLDRPWTRPVIEYLHEQGAEGNVACTRLLPGRYSVELVLHDANGEFHKLESSAPAHIEIPWPQRIEDFGEPEDEREHLLRILVRSDYPTPTLRSPGAAVSAAMTLLGSDRCDSRAAQALIRTLALPGEQWLRGADEAVALAGSRSVVVRASARLMAYVIGGGDLREWPDEGPTLLRLLKCSSDRSPWSRERFAEMSGVFSDAPLTFEDLLGSRARHASIRSLNSVLRSLRRIEASVLSINGRARGLLEVRSWWNSGDPQKNAWIITLARNAPCSPADLELLPPNVRRECVLAREWLRRGDHPDGGAVAALHVASFEAAVHLGFFSKRASACAEFLASVAKTFPEYVETRLAYALRQRLYLAETCEIA
ncbi:MAG: hypothetical protein K2R93_10990 [Gemmatimonadaceae bacterium]|nr:hypothetical protein [Gemmatimonadaceae bacterium]